MINVPIAQSLRFRPVDTNMPNFDNTFAVDADVSPYSFTHYVPAADRRFQVVTPDDNESLSYVDLIHNGTRTRITDLVTSFIGVNKYETYTIEFATYEDQCCYIEVFLEATPGSGEVLSYQTENFYVKTQSSYKLIEWVNDDNRFQMDYSFGLTHALQLEAKLRKLGFGGSSSIMENQGVKVKLKETVTRVLSLECEAPDYFIEILRLATAHDHFYINEVEYVVSEEPAINQLGDTGLYSFSAKVSQKTVIGLNSHDVG